MKYLCDFRMVLHVWDIDHDENGELIEWQPPAHEVLDLTTWKTGLLIPKINSKPLSTLLEERWNASEYDSSIGKDCIENSGFEDNVIKEYLGYTSGEKFYEIVGKYHCYSYQNWEGEWDFNDEITDVQWHEVAENDVKFLFTNYEDSPQDGNNYE